MISLTYLSRATDAMTRADLEGILSVSRVNNERDGLTGILLHADQHFIQTLEGEEVDVRTAFTRIGADPRHRSVDIVLREEIEERSFDGWSMGFKRLSHEEATRTLGYSDYLDPASDLYQKSTSGRAGAFHRAFRSFRAPQRAR